MEMLPSQRRPRVNQAVERGEEPEYEITADQATDNPPYITINQSNSYDDVGNPESKPEPGNLYATLGPIEHVEYEHPKKPVIPLRRSKKKRCVRASKECWLMSIVLLVSLSAFSLVILSITGVLGPSCSCQEYRRLLEDIAQLRRNMTNLSTSTTLMQTPTKPRAYNESDVIQGPRCPITANLAQCAVNMKQSYALPAPSVSASITVAVAEATGKKILHFSCSSNMADVVEQQLHSDRDKRIFACSCYGLANYSSFVERKMYCYITYTECPI